MVISSHLQEANAAQRSREAQNYLVILENQKKSIAALLEGIIDVLDLGPPPRERAAANGPHIHVNGSGNLITAGNVMNSSMNVSTFSNGDFQEAIKELQAELLAKQEDMDDRTFEVLHQMLRLIRKIDLQQDNIETTVGQVKESAGDLWVKLQLDEMTKSEVKAAAQLIGKVVAGKAVGALLKAGVAAL